VIHFKKKDAERRPRGSGLIRHCLRKELEEIRNTRRSLSEPSCLVALIRWMQEVRDEVKLRQEVGFLEPISMDQFSYVLVWIQTMRVFVLHRKCSLARAFDHSSTTSNRVGSDYSFCFSELLMVLSARIEQRPLALGWTKEELTFRYPHYNKWHTLVEQPRPLTDRDTHVLCASFVGLIIRLASLDQPPPQTDSITREQPDSARRRCSSLAQDPAPERTSQAASCVQIGDAPARSNGQGTWLGTKITRDSAGINAVSCG
jgi:hypothetical protein